MANIEDESNIVSRLFFTWVRAIFAHRPEDISSETSFPVPPAYNATQAASLLDDIGPKDRVAWLIIARFWWPILKQALLMIAATIAGIMGSFVLKDLVNTISADAPLSFLTVLALIALLLVNAITEQHSLHICLKLCVPMRATVLFGVLNKLLRIEAQRLKGFSGQIHNLMQKDAFMLAGVIADTAIYLINPVRALAVIAALYYLLGMSALVGVVLLALMIWGSHGLSMWLKDIAKHRTKASDDRLRITEWVLEHIEQLKLDKQLDLAYREITASRAVERRSIDRYAHCAAWLFSAGTATAVLVAFVTFGIYIYLEGSMSTGTALSAISLFALLRQPLSAMPALLARLQEGFVAAARIEAFLREPDQALKARDSSSPPGTAFLRGQPIAPGQLVAIVGKAGSGKTSLLRELCGLPRHDAATSSEGGAEAEDAAYSLDSSSSSQYAGDVAWVSQHSWLFKGSVVQNVVYDQPFDQQRLEAAVAASGLSPDIAGWAEGMHHDVGEGGTKVSGGQRMRIALARALYSNAAILILDDPFGPLDPAVADHVFKQAILESPATRIMVVNDNQWLSACDMVFEVDDHQLTPRPGQPSDSKAPSNAPSKGSGEAAEGKANAQAKAKAQSSSAPLPSETHREAKEQGVIGLSTIKAALTKSGGLPAVLLLVGAVGVAYISMAALDGFLSHWTTHRHLPDREFLLYYLGAGLFALLALMASWLVSARLTSKLSANAHRAAVEGVVYAPQRFHDRRTKGEMINRLSSDIAELDLRFFTGLSFFLSRAFGVLVMIAIALATQIYILPVFVAVFLAYNKTQKLFRSYSREVKRVNAADASPLYGLMGDIIKGADFIRVTRSQNYIRQSLLSHFEREQNSFYTLMALYRWLAIRLEILAVVIVAGLALFAMYLRGQMDAALLGLAITYAYMSSTQFTWFVRWLAKVESSLTSVERLMPYWRQTKPKASAGQRFAEPVGLSLDRLEFSYHGSGGEQSLALKGLSFNIRPGERLGICGRTGCGKSTVLKILAGLYPCDGGSFTAGDVMIDADALREWRQNVLTIRQRPQYAFGSIVQVLGDVPEETAYKALADVGLLASFTSQGLKLTDPVENWTMSPGEAQLFGLAKATLATEWCIIFDEVTSSLDPSGRQTFYHALNSFGPDKTVIVVSHDVGTLLRLGRVVVMAEGRIIEEGCPHRLIASEGSEFQRLFGPTRVQAPSLSPSPGPAL